MNVKKIITGKSITIIGHSKRHLVVRTVVNSFIKTEHKKKGRGITFRYPVENLPNGESLFIARPGHKKNFDFKVIIPENSGLGEGSHIEIAADLRTKRRENTKKFAQLLHALTEIYNCSENDIDKILSNRTGLQNSFRSGANVEFLLKVIKWLFIMEDIVYWDNEGRAFLFNFLRYYSSETSRKRLKEAMEKAKNPDRLKSFMKKFGIDWVPVED